MFKGENGGLQEFGSSTGVWRVGLTDTRPDGYVWCSSPGVLTSVSVLHPGITYTLGRGAGRSGVRILHRRRCSASLRNRDIVSDDKVIKVKVNRVLAGRYGCTSAFSTDYKLGEINVATIERYGELNVSILKPRVGSRGHWNVCSEAAA